MQHAARTDLLGFLCVCVGQFGANYTVELVALPLQPLPWQPVSVVPQDSDRSSLAAAKSVVGRHCMLVGIAATAAAAATEAGKITIAGWMNR